MRDSSVQTLLVGGNLDLATPPQTARRELLPHLPNGHQVVLPGLGHTDDFWSYEPAAADHLVNTFLDSGRVDASRYTPNRVDFDVFPQTTIAKIVLAVLVGFAALTVLSLLALWLRIHSRGRLGGKTGAGIRSAYAIVLGVGGWFGGVLLALTALPTVALDSELLACVSIGAPVGLVVFFASTGTSRTGLPRTMGFAAAVAGAFVGAWLGFNAVTGLFAVLTTAIGATAVSNLAVLVIDIAWHPQAAPAADPVRAPALTAD